MHISEVFKKNKTTLSFEFFPPKDQKNSEKLFSIIHELIPMHPSFVSVTYGAGGSTRGLTHDLVVKIQKETQLTVVAHLTCIGSTKKEIYDIMEKYCANGIVNIMALRGDRPLGPYADVPAADGFTYAEDLVRYIRHHFPGTGIGVAGFVEGHPESRNRLKEMDNLKRKVDAGADFICTQLFFDNRHFFDFRERCLLSGITIPVIAGLMPVTSFKNMHRIADLAAATTFPAKLLKSLMRADRDDLVENVGIHWTAEQVRDLLDNNVRGIHFYTLNKSAQIKKICDSIGIISSMQFV